jgi:transcriptional regulator with XRE-family HTH domain
MTMSHQLAAHCDEIASSIGARLACIRKARGLTQVDLAERLGIAQSAISDYERDRLRLHSELIIQLSRILEVSADDLLGITDEPLPDESPATKRLMRRIRDFESLSRRDQAALLRTIDAFLGKPS